MSIQDKLTAAIRQAGERIHLLKDDGVKPFYGSIQPDIKGAGETGGPLGFDMPRHFTLYAAFDDVSDEITSGDSILCRDSRYLVIRVEDICVSGIPVCRQAVLQMERGDGYGQD